LTLSAWAFFATVFRATLAALISIARTFFAQLLSHWLEWLGRGKDFQQTRTCSFLFWRSNRKHASAIEIALYFGSHHIFHCNSCRNDSIINDTFGLKSAGGTPRPRAVLAFAGEFNLNSP
jgi:hypothetical protein